jgi:hypothetical protein
MLDSFSTLAAGRDPLREHASALREQGFVVLPGPLGQDRIEPLAEAYDAAVASANGDDIRIGSTSIRVSGLVNRGPLFDTLYVFPPLLEACCRVIERPFKLSSLHARTLLPSSPNGELHVDVQRDSADWPLLGFILMVDEFRPDNGATRFVPCSHWRSDTPMETVSDLHADYPGQVLACGREGSLLIFDGSAWHGHTANRSGAPRRSIQGAFVPREGRAGTDFAALVSAETRSRLSEVAHYVLAL